MSGSPHDPETCPTCRNAASTAFPEAHHEVSPPPLLKRPDGKTVPNPLAAASGIDGYVVHVARPPKADTLEDCRVIAESVSLGPGIAGFFGHRNVFPEVIELVSLPKEGPVGPGPSFSYRREGFQVEYHLTKPGALDGKPFAYSLSIFIPAGVSERRALELILDKFRVFLEHELRENFLHRGEKAFDPHKTDASKPTPPSPDFPDWPPGS